MKRRDFILGSLAIGTAGIPSIANALVNPWSSEFEKCKKNCAYFVHKYLFPLTEEQFRALIAVQHNSGSIYNKIAPRRWGKTQTFAVGYPIWNAIFNNDSDTTIVVPNFVIGLIINDKISSILRGFPVNKIFTKTNLKHWLNNNSKIYIKTKEQFLSPGQFHRGTIVFDEIIYNPYQDMYYSVFMATGNIKKMIFVSS